jgi:hypothetical protein
MRTFFKMLITSILFDGKYTFNIPNNETTWEKMFINLPFDCEKMLEIKKEISSLLLSKGVNFNETCISGYWDGDATLHEKVLNHFVHIYNTKRGNNAIYGVTDLDQIYDYATKSKYSSREYLWFSQEKALEPVAIYIKNRVCYNIFSFYRTIYDYVRKYKDDLKMIKESKNILEKEKGRLTNDVSRKKEIEDEIKKLGSVELTNDDYILLSNLLSEFKPERNFDQKIEQSIKFDWFKFRIINAIKSQPMYMRPSIEDLSNIPELYRENAKKNLELRGGSDIHKFLKYHNKNKKRN